MTNTTKHVQAPLNRRPGERCMRLAIVVFIGVTLATVMVGMFASWSAALPVFTFGTVVASAFMLAALVFAAMFGGWFA